MLKISVQQLLSSELAAFITQELPQPQDWRNSRKLFSFFSRIYNIVVVQVIPLIRVILFYLANIYKRGDIRRNNILPLYNSYPVQALSVVIYRLGLLTRDRNLIQIDLLVSIYSILYKPVLLKNREPNPYWQLLEPLITQLKGQQRYIASTPEFNLVRFLLIILDIMVNILYYPSKVLAIGYKLLQSTLGVFELQVLSFNQISYSNLVEQRNRVFDLSYLQLGISELVIP